jgi:hypothetical protein
VNVCREDKHILNSPLCERSAMAVEAQGTALVGRRQKPGWMRLKLPAL